MKTTLRDYGRALPSTTAEIPPLAGHAPRVIREDAAAPLGYQIECECGHPFTPCPARAEQIDNAYYAMGYPRPKKETA